MKYFKWWSMKVKWKDVSFYLHFLFYFETVVCRLMLLRLPMFSMGCVCLVPCVFQPHPAPCSASGPLWNLSVLGLSCSLSVCLLSTYIISHIRPDVVFGSVFWLNQVDDREWFYGLLPGLFHSLHLGPHVRNHYQEVLKTKKKQKSDL